MTSASGVYPKTVLVKGVPTQIRCVDAAGHTLSISGRFPRIAVVEDEWFDEIEDAEAVIASLRQGGRPVADLVSFWNPLPESVPRHDLPHEVIEVAVLPIVSYEDWWNNRIKSRTRNLIRKAEKQGLVVRETQFDEAFIQGMADIFNEQPVRQGRRFWHYGKTPETIREQFSRFIHRETMIGAYVDDRMVGFIMLGSAGRCAHLGQILSRVSERERNPNNALMAKAVEVCEKQGHQNLVYGFWGDTSLAEFKRRCGFEPVGIPRYCVPLTTRGRAALRVGLQHGVRGLIPDELKSRLRQWRARAYELRSS
jgi:hypothetical protein